MVIKDYSLLIFETSLRDSGTYECVQESTKGRTKQTHNVIILEPPQIAETRQSTAEDELSPIKTTVLKGHSTVLQCPITGNPEPTITWSKLHFTPDRTVTLLSNEGRTLLLHPQEHEFYQCSGLSALGNVQILFEVSIESRPQIKNPKSVKLNPKLFSSLLLPCWTEGMPMANITWYRNTKLLQPSLRIRISANSQVVRISNVRSEDNGVYSCNAKNYLGSASKTFTVQVTLPTLLSPWSRWSDCSESCGLGTRQRTRECLFWNGNTASTNNTPQCAGEKLETEECLITECPVDGVWSEWTPWSPCSYTCKSALAEPSPSVKYRHRDCSNPAPAFGGSACKGTSYQQEICDVPFCPVDGGWSTFSNWSTCSVSCGDGVGMQVRNRICNAPVPEFNGRECIGESYEVKHCSEALCSATTTNSPSVKEIPLEWSVWSAWSECTALCGSGLKSRTRKCLNNAGECSGENAEFQQCEGKHCEARLKEEETYRWFYNPQATAVGKFRTSASASISSEEDFGEDQDDSSDQSEGPERVSLFRQPSNSYFNPQVSITLESSIPLTSDVSKIHFASQPATTTQRNKSCELGFEWRNGYCEGKGWK